MKDEWTERLMYGRGRVQGRSMSACRLAPWSHVLQALEQRSRRGAATKRERCQGHARLNFLPTYHSSPLVLARHLTWEGLCEAAQGILGYVRRVRIHRQTDRCSPSSLALSDVCQPARQPDSTTLPPSCSDPVQYSAVTVFITEQRHPDPECTRITPRCRWDAESRLSPAVPTNLPRCPGQSPSPARRLKKSGRPDSIYRHPPATMY